MHTLAWGGFESVADSHGALVSDYTVTSPYWLDMHGQQIPGLLADIDSPLQYHAPG
jgi:hypothetical protein